MTLKEIIKKSDLIMKTWHKICKKNFTRICKNDIKKAVQIRYEKNLGVKPNLNNPITINEKLQVLKLGKYYNNPLITTCVDKYLIKKYIKELFPNEEIKVAKLYGVFNSVESFENNGIENYPNSFVIKCNHGCGYNMLIKNKSEFNMEQAKKILSLWMNEEFWTVAAEPQYKFVEKRIIVEEYLGDNLEAFKFYCFNGQPQVVYVSSADETGEKDKYLDYFDMSWNHLDIQLGDHLHYPGIIKKPKNLEKMIIVSKRLSKDFPFVRVDLYNVLGEIYISELTFLPTGGYMRLTPKKIEIEWGNLLKL